MINEFIAICGEYDSVLELEMELAPLIFTLCAAN